MFQNHNGGEEYRSEGYCDICEHHTDQIFFDNSHERDSSNDWRECLECGRYWNAKKIAEINKES